VNVPRGAREGDVTGFVVLTRSGVRRRIAFWFRTERPRLRFDRHTSLSRTGNYAGNTSRGAARVTSYRYPDVPPGHAPFPVRLTGREVVYRVQIRRRIANFGCGHLARSGVKVEPRVVRAGDENRLAGYTALPYDQNPYRASYGRHRLVAGVALPGPGATTSSSTRRRAAGRADSDSASGSVTRLRRPRGSSECVVAFSSWQ
jgi:hypothetical protein